MLLYYAKWGGTAYLRCACALDRAWSMVAAAPTAASNLRAVACPPAHRNPRSQSRDPTKDTMILHLFFILQDESPPRGGFILPETVVLAS